MTLQAQFTIDPHTAEFRKLRSVCEPGNPWRCLIGERQLAAIRAAHGE